MITTPVKYDKIDLDFYPYPQIKDADGEYLFEAKDTDIADEVDMRINLHDDLVDALKTINNAYEMEFDDAIDEILSVRHKIESLLERCK